MNNKINYIGLWTVFRYEFERTLRVLGQTVVSPVVSTSLYFIVFGAALGSTISEIEGVSYSAYIVPGLLMMALVSSSFGAASSGIYFPKWTGRIYEHLTAPLSYWEICAGYVSAAVLRAVMVATVIALVSLLFTDIYILHPVFSFFFALGTAMSFALCGFVLGLWAQSFDQMSLMPNFIITPLSFLGGIFYSIEILPPFWQTVSLFNPFVYMINGLRYGFYGISDVSPALCLFVVGVFSLVNLLVVMWIFKTGYRLRP